MEHGRLVCRRVLGIRPDDAQAGRRADDGVEVWVVDVERGRFRRTEVDRGREEGS